MGNNQNKSDKITSLPEIFLSIFFAAGASYLLTLFAEKIPQNYELEWLFASFMIIVVAIMIISFIFNITIEKDYIMITKMFFVCFVTLSFFSFSRFLFYYYQTETPGSLRLTWYMLLAMLFASGLTLAFLGHLKEENKKQCYIFSGVILFLIVLFFMLTNRILYGGF